MHYVNLLLSSDREQVRQALKLFDITLEEAKAAPSPIAGNLSRETSACVYCGWHSCNVGQRCMDTYSGLQYQLSLSEYYNLITVIA